MKQKLEDFEFVTYSFLMMSFIGPALVLINTFLLNSRSFSSLSSSYNDMDRLAIIITHATSVLLLITGIAFCIVFSGKNSKYYTLPLMGLFAPQLFLVGVTLFCFFFAPR